VKKSGVSFTVNKTQRIVVFEGATNIIVGRKKIIQVGALQYKRSV
jgi:hypothetical protein